MHRVIIAVGPTASGKSALAVNLAHGMPADARGEIVSADARQVYRGLDIGTGKISREEMAGVPHHLLDVADPQHEQFSAGDFVERGRDAINAIVSRGNIPIVAGGTGFYIDALVGRMSLPEVPPNEELRETLRELPAEELYRLLQDRDPQRARTIERDNPRRLIRALEIVEEIGAVPAPEAHEPMYECLWIGIAPDTETLRATIATRLRDRIDTGMIEEARALHEHGLSYERMEELGLEYRSLARLLRGDITKEEMIAELERDIYKYAKRQMTYWRKNNEILWFVPENGEAIEREIRRFVST